MISISRGPKNIVEERSVFPQKGAIPGEVVMAADTDGGAELTLCVDAQEARQLRDFFHLHSSATCSQSLVKEGMFELGGMRFEFDPTGAFILTVYAKEVE